MKRGNPWLTGSIIVTVLAAAITWLVIGFEAKAQWALDSAITALGVLFTVLWVQAHQLDLLRTGFIVFGFGTAGASIIGIARSAWAA